MGFADLRQELSVLPQPDSTVLLLTSRGIGESPEYHLLQEVTNNCYRCSHLLALLGCSKVSLWRCIISGKDGVVLPGDVSVGTCCYRNEGLDPPGQSAEKSKDVALRISPVAAVLSSVPGELFARFSPEQIRRAADD